MNAATQITKNALPIHSTVSKSFLQLPTYSTPLDGKREKSGLCFWAVILAYMRGIGAVVELISIPHVSRHSSRRRGATFARSRSEMHLVFVLSFLNLNNAVRHHCVRLKVTDAAYLECAPIASSLRCPCGTIEVSGEVTNRSSNIASNDFRRAS